MFIWFKCLGIEDTRSLIVDKAVKAKVLMVPGSAFEVEEGIKSQFVRASFSASTPELMEEALKRFGDLLRQEKV